MDNLPDAAKIAEQLTTAKQELKALGDELTAAKQELNEAIAERPPLTAEERSTYQKALGDFQKILDELVSGSNAPAPTPPPRLTRNPFVKFYRYWKTEPRFDETVAKYASMFHILETSSGLVYSKMALLGITALKARYYGSKSTKVGYSYRNI